MRRRPPALGAGVALVTLALSSPSLASWAVPGRGSAPAAATALGTPTGLTATAVSSSAVTLSWSAPGGLAPDAYVVRRDGEVVAACAARTVTSCTDTGLSERTAYTYTVSAVRQRWVGSPSAAASVRTAAADTTPPTATSIVATDPSPTAASSVGWTVTFSEPVTGVDVSDFVLVSTASGAAITTATGSGDTWTVRASTGTGSGTVRLDLVDDDTVQDGAGNLLGGPGPGNGSVSGGAYVVDRTALDVVVTRQAAVTGTSPVRFTVQFTKQVADFTSSDVVLAGTAGATTAAVTGSGTTYDVAVTGMTSQGTVVVSVPAGRATDATGSGNTASTGESSVVWDTVRPVVSSVVKTDRGGNRERFSGVSTEGTGRVVVTVLSGATVVQTYSVTAFSGSGGAWSWGVDTSKDDLASGATFRFEVVHTDSAGNASATVDGGTFTGN